MNFKKNTQKKKAQAAMEFLMTYGWAILVVLAAIGALAYFGVLSPQNYIGGRCLISTGIFCQDSTVKQTETIIVLSNSLGRDILLENITFGECITVFDSKFPSGVQTKFTLNCTTDQGSFKKPLVITYRDLVSGLDKDILGEISGQVK